jgi:hypothetical protein
VQLASAEFLSVAPRRVNVLLTGPDRAIARLLDAVEEHLCQPVMLWHRGRALVLPHDGEGTLVIRDLGALTRGQQERLFDWMTVRSCRTQIVSTSPDPLLTDVQAGRFMTALFYRLNVVSLDLT